MNTLEKGTHENEVIEIYLLQEEASEDCLKKYQWL
jgi:hypothetical protein